MYKVLVVDDDNMVRLAMKTMLDWNACGFALCGAAENGEQALRMAREKAPDLVITDVDMPGMNGLELLGQLRKNGPACEVLLLSNYNDFSYVRQGLREGALDYILKVELDQDTLLAALEKAAAALRRRRAEGGAAARQAEEPPEKAPGPWPGPADLYYIRVLGGGARPLKQGAVQRVCAGVLAAGGGITFQPLPQGDFFVLDPARGAPPQQAARQIRTQLKLYLDYEAAVLFAPGLRGPRELAEARRRLAAEADRMRQARPPAPQDLEQAQSWLREFSFAKYRGGEAELLAALDRVFEALPRVFETEAQAKGYLQEQVTQGYWLMAGRERVSLPELVKRLEGAGGYEALRREVDAFAREYTRPQLRAEVRRVCGYIQANLAQKLTLDELAAEAGLKKSYLCTLFKQSTGQSIGEYILNERLRRAERLLAETDLRICEIGLQVGIPDPLYFSKVFKRRYGVAPSQFKR